MAMARRRRPFPLPLPLLLLPPRSIIVDTDTRGPLHSPQILLHGSSSSSSRGGGGGGGRAAVKGMALRDPGDWRFSPEWWGSQGHGWGRNEGSTLFSHASCKSNGIVTVTSHPASTSVCPYHSLLCHYFDFIQIVCLNSCFHLISFCETLLLRSFHMNLHI